MNRDYIYILATLLLLSACSSSSAEDASPEERFIAAMVDSSRDLTQADIYDGLIPIKYGESSFTEWSIEQGDTLVLVASLQDRDWLYSNVEAGENFTTESSSDNVIWVAIPRQIDSVLSKEAELVDSLSLNTRLLELIGLRPDDKSCVMNLFWVNKDDLLRPSYNPDPTTTYGAIECPEELLSEWYAEWLEGTIAYSYESLTEGLNYPFTRLGYTYDWGEGSSKYGVSEFIIAPSSTITLYERVGCWSYYQSKVVD